MLMPVPVWSMVYEFYTVYTLCAPPAVAKLQRF